MSHSWEYAEMTKLASEHGGPQVYLDWVKQGARAEGRAQGVAIGLTLAFIVSQAYNLFVLKRHKERAAIAEQHLLGEMSPDFD